jgi:predicted ATPase
MYRGIHTGPVVVGEMGSGGRYEHLATGETVNIAARLEGLAAPNTVVLSTVTARLVERAFTLESLGPQMLKGVVEPMPVFRVLGPLEDHEDETHVTDAPFLVGRDEEMGLRRRRWEQSKAGLGQVVLISGEAGVGKSTLVETLRTQVRQESLPRLTYRCSPYHINSAFYPIIAHMQRVCGLQPNDTPATKLDKLEHTLQAYDLPLEEAVPLLGSLLSIPLAERYATLSLSPQRQRQQTQDILVAWLLHEAERQPVLAVWEDLHWADPSTLEVLGLLIDQTPTVSMLHVLTFRPSFTPSWPARSHMTPITLNRLERLQVEALVRHLADGKCLPAEVVEPIVTKTDGVPLFVEELTKMFLESSLLQENTDHYTLTGPLAAAPIPVTLQDSLMARLDQLGTAKEVAQLGAVLGREFAYEMIQTIWSQDEDTLRAGLSRLVEAELLYERGRSPRARYLFKHVLIQEAAYASLLRSTRQHLHQQVAQQLEAQFPETVETQPELLAHHYTEAGLHTQAIGYWQRAGQRALQRSAHAEAIAHLKHGLTVLTMLPETPRRRQQELDFQVALGPALIAARGYGAPDVEHVYSRAWELCRQMGDTPQLFPVLRGALLYYLVRGQVQTAYRLAKQLLHLAQSRTDSALLLLAHCILGVILHYQGKPAAAQTHHRQALTIYTPQEHQPLALRYGIDLGTVAYHWLAWDLWLLGYPDQALHHSQTACTLAQEVSHPYSLIAALIGVAHIHRLRREVSAAYTQAVETTTLATEQGFTQWVAEGTVLYGWALAMQGQAEAGIAAIRQGHTAILATGARLVQSYFPGLLAEAYRAGGHPDEGLEALAVMDITEAPFYEAELYRLKGVLLLQQAVSNAPQAEAYFHQALDIARQQQAKSWELRAAISLARLWQSQDKRRDAFDLLAPVYEWFTEGFDTADLREAKALLEELA